MSDVQNESPVSESSEQDSQEQEVPLTMDEKNIRSRANEQILNTMKARLEAETDPVRKNFLLQKIYDFSSSVPEQGRPEGVKF
jgi:hypothetical protein